MNLVQTYKIACRNVVHPPIWMQGSCGFKSYLYIDIKQINNNAIFVLPERAEPGSVVLFSYDNTSLIGWQYNPDNNRLFFSPDFIQVNKFPSCVTVQYTSLK